MVIDRFWLNLNYNPCKIKFSSSSSLFLSPTREGNIPFVVFMQVRFRLSRSKIFPEFANMCSTGPLRVFLVLLYISPPYCSARLVLRVTPVVFQCKAELEGRLWLKQDLAVTSAGCHLLINMLCQKGRLLWTVLYLWYYTSCESPTKRTTWFKLSVRSHAYWKDKNHYRWNC